MYMFLSIFSFFIVFMKMLLNKLNKLNQTDLFVPFLHSKAMLNHVTLEISPL